MLSVKQGGIKYHFLSLWYDSTWDWTQVTNSTTEGLEKFVEMVAKEFLLTVVIAKS